MLDPYNENHEVNSSPIDIVLVGNIATCGMEAFSRALKIPHRLRTYPCDLSVAEVLIGPPIFAAHARAGAEAASGPRLRRRV